MKTRWWLNQPIWKNARQKGSGWKKIFETTTGQKITDYGDYGLYEEHQPEQNDTVDGRTPAPPGMSKIL